MEAQAVPPLKVTPAHQTLRVEPGASVTFAVTLKGEQVGPFESEIRIAGAGTVIRVPVKVSVALPKSGPKQSGEQPSTGPAASQTPAQHDVSDTKIIALESPTVFQQMVMGYLRSKGLPMAKDKINFYLERVKDVRISERTSSSITLAWRKPEIMPARWEVEASTVNCIPESNTFIKVWKPFKSWEPVRVDADRIGIRLHTLSEGSQIEIRIMGVDRDGKFSEPSFPLALETLPAWQIPFWFWELLVVVALVIAIYYLVRIRRGDFDK